jgi:hypothetical protein
MYGWEPRVRYGRQSFLYARSFAGGADLHAQALHWLATVAKVRLHATTKEQPLVRFERDERLTLRPLAPRPYHTLVLPPDQPVARAAQCFGNVRGEVSEQTSTRDVIVVDSMNASAVDRTVRINQGVEDKSGLCVRIDTDQGDLDNSTHRLRRKTHRLEADDSKGSAT